jgi:alpha-L-glutamate ligase-like protein
MWKYLKKSKSILGINARNLDYIRPSNSSRAIRIADNKLLSKKILKKNNLPTLETYSIISYSKELDDFDWTKLPNTFTLKPNRGFGGEGILTVYAKKKKFPHPWVKASREIIKIDDLKEHVLNILEGIYSLSGLPDTAIFEERIKLLKLFKPYAIRGVPDIRIIVYNLVPVMAELRLPTQYSGGRSNLHLGGIGVGIDMASGITTSAIQNDHLIEYYPGTRLKLRGLKIPFWNEILKLAIEAQKASRLGFSGVDIAIDRDKGPIILELNARPGLSIQIANLAPLKDRLQRVRGLKVKTTEKGVNLAKELFGEEMDEPEELAKKSIGIYEQIDVIDAENEKRKITAKIDTGAYFTSIDQSLAEELGLMGKITRYARAHSALGEEKRPLIELSFILAGTLVETEASLADRSKLRNKILIGRRDLKKFLIDPTKILIKK